MHQYCRGTHKLNSTPYEFDVTPIITDFDTLDHYIDFYCGTYEGKECTVPCNYLKCYSYSAYLTIKNDSSYWGSVRFETWANIHESYKSNHMHKLNQKMISNESGDKRGKIEVVISNEDIGTALSEKISFINNNKTYRWEDSRQLLYIIGRIKNMTEISGKLIINSYILSDGKIIDSLEGGNNHLCLSKAKNCLEKFKLVKEGK